MAGVNKIILLGNIGNDPEIRFLPSGKKVASFNLATSENYKNSKGEKCTNTEWWGIEVWENLADITEKFVKKGSQIYLEGKGRTEKYTDKVGIS